MSTLGDAVLLVSKIMFKDFTHTYSVVVADVNLNKELDTVEPKIGKIVEVYKDGELYGTIFHVDDKNYLISEVRKSLGKFELIKAKDKDNNVKTFLVGSEKRLLWTVDSNKTQMTIVVVPNKANEREKLITIVLTKEDQTLRGPVVEEFFSDIRFGNIFKYWNEAQKTKKVLQRAFENAKTVYYDISAGVCNYPQLEYFLGKEKVCLVRYRENGKPVKLCS